jgi:hypothetical protein
MFIKSGLLKEKKKSLLVNRMVDSVQSLRDQSLIAIRSSHQQIQGTYNPAMAAEESGTYQCSLSWHPNAGSFSLSFLIFCKVDREQSSVLIRHGPHKNRKD